MLLSLINECRCISVSLMVSAFLLVWCKTTNQREKCHQIVMNPYKQLYIWWRRMAFQYENWQKKPKFHLKHYGAG